MSDLQPFITVTLLPELIEQILTIHADSHYNDHALQWTSDRHLSAHQLRRLERYFYLHWLPKLCITVYVGHWESVDYRLDTSSSYTSCGTATTSPGTASSSPRSASIPSIVTFVKVERDGSRPFNFQDTLTKSIWNAYDPSNPSAHLRLGEDHFNDGLKEFAMINDSEIVGLQVSDDARSIKFNWRDTFTAFFKEEILLRRKRDELASSESSFVIPTNYAWLAMYPGKIRDLLSAVS